MVNDGLNNNNANRKRTTREFLETVPKIIGEHEQWIVNTNQMIGKGSYGAIFICENMNNVKAAVKFEEKPMLTRKPVLYYDQQFLNYLSRSSRCEYVPAFYEYGVTSNYHHLIMDLLGPNMIDIFKKAPEHGLSVKTLTLLCLGMLQSLHEIHAKKIIHRDLKPENFALGSVKKPRTVFIIDFGLSKQYFNQGRHIPKKTGKDLTGTARYVSLSTHYGIESCRSDDIESLGIVFMFLFNKGKLPWIGLPSTNKTEQFARIAEIKARADLYDLCKHTPELAEIVLYARKIPFGMDPNYQFLFMTLNKILTRRGLCATPVRFDWDDDFDFFYRLRNEFGRINYTFDHDTLGRYNLEENGGFYPHYGLAPTGEAQMYNEQQGW